MTVSIEKLDKVKEFFQYFSIFFRRFAEKFRFFSVFAL